MKGRNAANECVWQNKIWKKNGLEITQQKIFLLPYNGEREQSLCLKNVSRETSGQFLLGK